MAAATATLHQPFGLGPRGPHGGQRMQGPPQPTPGPSAPPPPEEHHHKPFFYIQPSQPYMPMQNMQWPVPLPMPVSYNPYYGYPGIGYGMPMMPPYPPNPYMEAPSFVVPQSHLHLMDYRRMLNPQYYQSMAYHARRLRYQHNAPSKEMTSSEVQTEPLSVSRRTSAPGSSSAVASSGLMTCSSDAISIPTSQSLSPALAVQKEEQSMVPKDVVPSSTTRTTPNGSFVIQTEEVRIECCTTPVGLQVLHSHETAELSHSFSKDVVQCSSILQSHVLQDNNLSLPVDQSEQAPQPCPDILLVGTSCTDENILALEESRNQTDTAAGTSDLGSQMAHINVEESSKKYPTSKNFDFKVVCLPFDSNYLDELRRMESTVWSGGEDTLVPSPDFLIESHDEILTVVEVPSADALIMREEADSEDVVPVIEMPPLPEEELQDLVPTVEPPDDDMVCEADICPVMDVPVAEEAPVTELKNTAAPQNYLMDKADENQQRQESNTDHQDTSFESLPTCLPTSSLLSDFDSIHYCNKTPPTIKKTKPLSNRVLDGPSRRRKLELEYKEPAVRKPKEGYKPKGKADRLSISDYECCISRNFNENAFLPYGLKERRLCTRCLAKRRVYTSASPRPDGQALKRKASPFQQWNDLPTCDGHLKRRPSREGSSPDVWCSHHGRDTEGESSENGSCRTALKWRAAEDQRKFAVIKKPLASKQNLERCPTATYPKWSEKNCMCNELQHHPTTWQRLHHCPHGNTIRETDENCAMVGSVRDKWRNTDHTYLAQRCQTEKSWKAVMPNHERETFKNEARAQYLNKHKKSQPQSRGTYRKDTRC